MLGSCREKLHVNSTHSTSNSSYQGTTRARDESAESKRLRFTKLTKPIITNR